MSSNWRAFRFWSAKGFFDCENAPQAWMTACPSLSQHRLALGVFCKRSVGAIVSSREEGGHALIVESAALACGLWTALDALDACALVSLFIPLISRYSIIIISTQRHKRIRIARCARICSCTIPCLHTCHTCAHAIASE